MKKILILGLSIILSGCISIAAANEENSSDIRVSNHLFSISLPAETKGTYSVLKKSNGIFIHDKESKKSGFGGFAFGVKAFKTPSGHAMMPGGKKIGELVKGKGKPYDMVLIYPTDIQFDYEKGAPDSYIILFKQGENTDIKGKFGHKFIKDRGMKGVDLYSEILSKHLNSFEEKWDSDRLEKEGISTAYSGLTLDKIGYAYCDINDDGIDELIIGEIAEGAQKSRIYDIYTMVNRKPAHVISGGNSSRFYICNDYFISHEYTSEDGENIRIIYTLVENSTEMYPQMGFKYDKQDRFMPWYLSYNLEDEWKNVSEGTFNSRKSAFSNYTKLEYKSFSSLKSIE